MLYRPEAGRESDFIDNLLVRVHLVIEMSRPALRHGSLDSLFQIALHLAVAPPCSLVRAELLGLLELLEWTVE